MSQCQPERNFVSTYLRRCEAYDFIVEDLPLFPERGLWDTIDLAGFDLMKGRGVLCEVLPLPPGNVIGEPDRQTIQRLEKKLVHAYRFVRERMVVLKRGIRFQVWSPSLSAPLKRDLQRIAKKAHLPVDVITDEAYAARVDQLLKKAKQDRTLWGEPFYRLMRIAQHAGKSMRR